MADLIQVDGIAIGGKRMEVGQVFIKAFFFEFQQIRAVVEANTIVVIVARMLQLLQLLRQKRNMANVSAFPVSQLSAHCADVCWRWSARSFTSLVYDTNFSFRPVHLACSKAELLDVSVDDDTLSEKLHFIYR
eukprot:6193178-Pleurochrysis_carterae.AAC.1